MIGDDSIKLEVGMYVRTKKGIAQITSMYSEPNQYIVYTDNENIVFEYYLKHNREWTADEVKASHNIIDLIEVVDYVNGELVLRIEKVPNEEIDRIIVTSTLGSCDEAEYNEIHKEDIKSIVTKEQFSSMEYKI